MKKRQSKKAMKKLLKRMEDARPLKLLFPGPFGNVLIHTTHEVQAHVASTMRCARPCPIQADCCACAGWWRKQSADMVHTFA